MPSSSRSTRVVVGTLLVGASIVRSGCAADAATGIGNATRSAAASGTATAVAAVGGRWKVMPASIAGYRVKERFAGGVAKVDAVGRTQKISGTLEVVASGSRVAARNVNVVIDMRTLTSDRPRRDNALRTRGLQTDRFPRASFSSTSEVSVPNAALAGTVFATTARGELTLHGVTKAVKWTVRGRYADNAIELLISEPIDMSDYSIDPPSIAGVVDVDGAGVLEVKLVLAKE